MDCVCFVQQGQRKLPDANNDFVSLLYMLAYSIINKTCRTCAMLLLCGNERAGNHSINHWSIEHTAVLILLYTIQKNERAHIHTLTLTFHMTQTERVFEIFDDEITVAYTHTYIHTRDGNDKTNERTNEEITSHRLDGAKRF